MLLLQFNNLYSIGLTPFLRSFCLIKKNQRNQERLIAQPRTRSSHPTRVAPASFPKKRKKKNRLLIKHNYTTARSAPKR